MVWTVLSLAAIFTAWFLAGMWLLYLRLRSYSDHGVPMVPSRWKRALLPWWNWKHFTWAFLARNAMLALLHIGITALALWLAWLAI